MDMERLIEIFRDNIVLIVGLGLAGVISVYLLIIIKRIMFRVFLFFFIILLPALFVIKIYFFEDESFDEIKERGHNLIEKSNNLINKFGEKSGDSFKNKASDFIDQAAEGFREKVKESLKAELQEVE